jgi:glycosyltransferase involved in cell wall biosynthesis
MADTPAVSGTAKQTVDFSCIIPTHDRDDMLRAAIESILVQTVFPKEVIVSDNLMRGETRQLIETMDAVAPFSIRYLGHDKGGRGCISRNLAAQEAAGRYLAFLDDDDLWEPGFLAAVDAAFAERQADAVYVWLTYLYPDGARRSGRTLRENLPLSAFVIRNPGAVISNLAVTRTAFLKIGGFDEAMHPPYDRDFIMRLLLDGGRYAVVPHRLLLFRQHDGLRESRSGESYAVGQKAFFARYSRKLRLTLRLRFWLKMKASAIRAGVETLPFPLGSLLEKTDRNLKTLERKIGRAIG